MRTVVVIVPELLNPENPILEGKARHISALAARSRLFRLSQLESVETPEARLLGLRPTDAELRQGPLTLSALRVDPPSQSLHFHLSLLGFADGLVVQPDVLPSADEAREIADAAAKLNTRLLTFVKGNGLDHGLVWEKLADLATTPASEVLGKSIRSYMPEGDGEPMLRQYIDDSVNLLEELELNHRRLDEGLAPLNLLWPWGHGVRKPVPNLALRRASPALVMSSSLRLYGLARLAGYAHCDLNWLGSGLQTRFGVAFGRAIGEPTTIIVIDAIEEFRGKGELDEAAYVAAQMDEHLFGQLYLSVMSERIQVLLLAPSAVGVGLGFQCRSREYTESTYPFDERSIDERAVPILDMEDAIDAALRPEESE